MSKTTSLRLTKKAIDSFVYEGDGQSRDVRWDTTLPGLGVRAYPTGRKAFVLSYRFLGRKRLMVIGDYGPMTLDQARSRARKLLVGIEDGLDPLDQKRLAAEGRTFGELIDAYIERHAKPRKKTWAKDESRLRRHIPARWKSRKADSIDAQEIGTLHEKIGKGTPYEANRLLEVLRKMFNLAPKWGYLKPEAPNPAKGIEKFKERKRKRWLKPEELPALVKAIDKEANVYVRSALWLYMLSGVRKTELLEARWSDIDWTRGMLRLPDTKSDEEQYVALSAPALAILQAIPRMSKNPYILPGRKKGKHLVNITKPWGRIRKAAGIEDVRLHDLRRTVGSWMSQGGVDLNTVKDALRHQNISTTLTYAQLGADPARAAMEEHGRKVMEAAKRKGPLAVVGGTESEG